MRRTSQRILIAAFGIGVLAGCSRPSVLAGQHGQELTPSEFTTLSDKEKVRAKDVIVRVPDTWGGTMLPLDRGPFRSTTEKTIHSGDVETMMGMYNQTLFELQHPRVKIEYVNFDTWSTNFRAALAVALSANRAPAYYVARDLPQTIYQGMYADLTDVLKGWDQFGNQPEGSVREGTVNGRLYTLAGNEMGYDHVVRYRKDWFKEAGIFNEFGEPGPRSDWTWDDFRAICKKLTDPAKGRYGYCGQMGDFLDREALGLNPLYIPDPTGKHTWRFNDQDPDLIRSLQAARDMVNVEKSVLTSTAFGWYEFHHEFDASHAAMIRSFSPHIAYESQDSPDKFGKDHPFGQTVGMAPPPRGPEGLTGMRPVTNQLGFDPTLSKEQLAAAFEWCKFWFYGDGFVNRMRSEILESKAKKRGSHLYSEMLVLPYKPVENLLDKPLEQVFPIDYVRTYKQIRESKAPPLPREFGLREPPEEEWDNAVKAMYSEAITSGVDLRQLVRKTADLVNVNLLNFGGPEDRAALRRFIDARSEYYRKNFPRYFAGAWQRKLATYMRVP